MSTMVKESTDVLSANDRCDRCNAQAFVWINGVSGDLLFCRHHYLLHEDKLREYAFDIIDETHKLGIKVESSA